MDASAVPAVLHSIHYHLVATFLHNFMCKKHHWCTHTLHTFSQIKMRRDTRASAEHQLSHSIYGNWNHGITVMGGIICLGGLVSTPRNMLLCIAQFCPSLYPVDNNVHIQTNRRLFNGSK